MIMSTGVPDPLEVTFLRRGPISLSYDSDVFRFVARPSWLCGRADFK